MPSYLDPYTAMSSSPLGSEIRKPHGELEREKPTTRDFSHRHVLVFCPVDRRRVVRSWTPSELADLDTATHSADNCWMGRQVIKKHDTSTPRLLRRNCAAGGKLSAVEQFG